MTDDHHSGHAGRWPNVGRYVFFGFAAIAAFFLFTDHARICSAYCLFCYSRRAH